MLRQYHCSPHRLTRLPAPRGAMRFVPVGTIPVGTIFRWKGRHAIVEAWLPRECAAAWRCPHTREWVSSFHAHGMFLAVVRSLDSGRRSRLADHHIRRALDAEDVFLEPHRSERKRGAMQARRL